MNDEYIVLSSQQLQEYEIFQQPASILCCLEGTGGEEAVIESTIDRIIMTNIRVLLDKISQICPIQQIIWP